MGCRNCSPEQARTTVWKPPLTDPWQPPSEAEQNEVASGALRPHGSWPPSEHTTLKSKKKAHKHKFFCPVRLGTTPGLSQGFHRGCSWDKSGENLGQARVFSLFYTVEARFHRVCPWDKPGLSLGQSRGRRAAQKVNVKKVYVPFSLAKSEAEQNEIASGALRPHGSWPPSEHTTLENTGWEIPFVTPRVERHDSGVNKRAPPFSWPQTGVQLNQTGVFCSTCCVSGLETSAPQRIWTFFAVSCHARLLHKRYGQPAMPHPNPYWPSWRPLFIIMCVLSDITQSLPGRHIHLRCPACSGMLSTHSLRALFPLTAFKNARTPSLSKICPDDCFSGFQSGGPKFVKNVSENWKTTISGQIFKISTISWQSFGLLIGAPKNNRRDKFWTNLGFGAFLKAVKGKRVRNS